MNEEPKVVAYEKVKQDIEEARREKEQESLYKIHEFVKDTMPDSTSYERLILDLNYAIKKNKAIKKLIESGDGTKSGKTISFKDIIDVNVSFEDKIRKVSAPLIGDFMTIGLFFSGSKYQTEKNFSFFSMTIEADEAGSYTKIISHSLFIGGEHPSFRPPTLQELKEFMSLTIKVLED